MNEREIFLAALDIDDLDARRAYVESSCLGNNDLLSRVEALLSSHEGQSKFLKNPVGQQLAAVGDDATRQFHGDSSEDDDSSAVANVNAPSTMSDDHSDDGTDESLLAYLQPASRDDSLGRLAHYEILEILGRGAFGTVLKAFDEKLQRVVAIKMMSPELAATSPARKRFLREARASAAIRHDNVVAIYAVEDDPIPYLVMEYIPGRTLQQRLDEHGPLDLQDVLRLGKQIADGLAAAHAEDLIHRDVKPGNILLETGVDDRVKITDFGLARTADDASLTQSGMIAGTPMYMAPEQAHGQKLDQRADLFSLGSVLYQMISGRPPFRAPNTMAVLKRVTEVTPRPIQEIIPETPVWLCQLVANLHEKNPDDRYSSAKVAGDLLTECLAEHEQGRIPNVPTTKRLPKLETVSRPAASVPKETCRPRRLLKVASILLILLAGLGLTEATGLTRLTSTVIRLATGSGTLVIETDDPNIKVTIDGEEVTIRGAGVAILTLRPGNYKVAASKDGKTVKRELVTISRNGKTVFRMSFAPNGENGNSVKAKTQKTKPFQWPKDAPPFAIAPFDAKQAKQHQQAWAKYLGVPLEKDVVLGKDKAGKEVKLTLVLIPPGEFMMGASKEENDKYLTEAGVGGLANVSSETPRHRVRITRPFYLGKHEVTQAQWEVVTERNPSWFKDNPEHPAAPVSWKGAQKFVTMLNKSAPDKGMQFGIPTEAQWEYACRAGTTTYWNNGNSKDDLKQCAWFVGNSGWKTHPVGQLQPNAFGLHDMHGNVWEVCDDWYAPNYYAKSPVDDPVGPSEGEFRVARGGGWRNTEIVCRAACRLLQSQWVSMRAVGFRLAASIELPKKPKATAESKPFQWPKDAPPFAVAPFDTKQAQQHQQAWAKYLGVPVEKDIVVGKDKDGADIKLTMILIPPGEFLMGATKVEQDWFLSIIRDEIPAANGARVHPGKNAASEVPQHRVRITRPFYLSKYEVTQAQWRAVLKVYPGKYLKNQASHFQDNSSHPMESVDWRHVQSFLKWLNERDFSRKLEFALPTEARWEYACRAGTTTMWHSGDSAVDVKQYAVINQDMTQPVGRFKPNAFGLYDMHGNVGEWCADFMGFDYYAKSPANDPRGPEQPISGRITRGGSWKGSAGWCRSAYRGKGALQTKGPAIGFRLAAALPDDVIRAKLSSLQLRDNGE